MHSFHSTLQFIAVVHELMATLYHPVLFGFNKFSLSQEFSTFRNAPRLTVALSWICCILFSLFTFVIPVPLRKEAVWKIRKKK